jgi:hypothetical protein
MLTIVNCHLTDFYFKQFAYENLLRHPLAPSGRSTIRQGPCGPVLRPPANRPRPFVSSEIEEGKDGVISGVRRGLKAKNPELERDSPSLVAWIEVTRRGEALCRIQPRAEL